MGFYGETLKVGIKRICVIEVDVLQECGAFFFFKIVFRLFVRI